MRNRGTRWANGEALRRPVSVAGALLGGVLLAGALGCTKGSESTSGTDAAAPVDAATGGSPATDAAAEMHSDPAIRTLQEFIAKHEVEPDRRGRKIDRSSPNWRTTLPKPPLVEFTEGKDYLLRLKTNRGPVTIRLRPDLAPMHVANALYLSLLGFYDGSTSHRAIKRFMVQAGSPDGRGFASLGYALDLEADKRHVYDRPGLMAAARTPDPNSAGSQFFLMLAPYPGLNHQYTIYGELAEDQKIESQMTLREMEKVSNPGDGPPLQPIVFEEVTVAVE